MTIAHAPGASRALAHDDDIAAEDPAAAKAWQVRARLWLLVRAVAVCARGKRALSAAATVALDKAIASLQALRKCTGAAEEQDSARERGRPEKRTTAQRLKEEPAAKAAIAPKPRRRLRGLLLYLSVMLAGGMLGMAVAYDLLAQLLERRAVEIERKEAKLSAYSKSLTELKKALKHEQAQRTTAQERLMASLAQNKKILGELQAPRTQAELHAASMPDARAGGAWPQEHARGTQGGWTRSGDCTLGGGDVRAALAGCIADMNRR